MPRRRARGHAPDSGELLDQIESSVPAAEQVEPPAEPSLFAAEETAADIAAILADMAAEPDCTFQPASQLFRISPCAAACGGWAGGHRSGPVPPPLCHGGGHSRRSRAALAAALKLAEGVADDVLAPFLVLAVAARACHARMTSAWPKSMARAARAHPPPARPSRKERADRRAHRLWRAPVDRHSRSGHDDGARRSLSFGAVRVCCAAKRLRKFGSYA
jgi:hypothetical protein